MDVIYDQDLENEIKEYYIDKFYNNNDKGHGSVHIEEVFSRALKIGSNLNIIPNNDSNSISIIRHNKERLLILLASYLHDAFSSISRRYHHIEAANYVINNSDIFLNMLSVEERYLVANSILVHRASLDIKCNSWLATLLSLADKDEPNVFNIVTRIYLSNVKIKKDTAIVKIKNSDIEQFTITATNKIDLISKIKNNKELRLHVYKHLIDKFSKDGYLYKKSSMEFYKSYYHKDLFDMWDIITLINVDNISDYFKTT